MHPRHNARRICGGCLRGGAGARPCNYGLGPPQSHLHIISRRVVTTVVSRRRNPDGNPPKTLGEVPLRRCVIPGQAGSQPRCIGPQTFFRVRRVCSRLYTDTRRDRSTDYAIHLELPEPTLEAMGLVSWDSPTPVNNRPGIMFCRRSIAYRPASFGLRGLVVPLVGLKRCKLQGGGIEFSFGGLGGSCKEHGALAQLLQRIQGRASHHSMRPQHTEFIHSLLLAVGGLKGGSHQFGPALEAQRMTGR